MVTVETDHVTAYLTALQTGNPDAIITAADNLDAFDQQERDRLTRPTALADAAHYYATRNIPIFPLQPGTKIPLPHSRGFKDATTNTDQIREWWERTPQANIGAPTGHLWDVIDIDTTPINGWWSLAGEPDTFNTITTDAIGKTLTPSGGAHILVPPSGRGNSTALLPGVDYRGVGGYVVLPPSRTGTNLYRWASVPAELR